MKKLIYSLSIALFIAGSVNATTIEPLSEKENLKTVKIEKAETVKKLVVGKTVFFNTYTGRCLDGTTFQFQANSREEAQGFVNGYCAAKRELTVAPN